MNKTCVQCHAENPEQARFCMNCGTALAGQSCANCQATLAATARFCDQCGHPAGNQLDSDRHRQTRLAAHAPETLTRKLMAEGKLSGERRVVTMLFADVVGSTSMGEQLDAESWTAIMNGAFERIMQPIYLYEGTIARLMGDALLAFFGAPIRHEDDPERAVKAGLALLDAAAAYSRDVEGRYGLRFQMRVGINTGEVVVGAVGSNLMYEYTAMGDAVNLAARMEQTAEPGTVQISEHTYAFLAPLLDVEPRGPIVIKGKAAPVEAFVVRGFRSQPGRRRGLGTGPTRLVGRKTEVAALEQAILQVAAGESRMVALLAEAGMGKSRLIEEARDIWQTGVGDGAPIFSFTGVSYETIHAYGPFREWLQAEAKTPADRQTLHRLLGGGVEPEADRVDKEEIFAFIVGLFEQAIGQRSALFVFDDLHWMDSASLEVILHLMKSTKDRPALLLLATRPEHSHPAWQVLAAGRSVYGNRLLELALEPLNAAESYALMTDAFVIQRLPSDVLEKIQTRADGNPFFIEEIIRNFIERGWVRQDEGRLNWQGGEDVETIVIPPNVNALLAARIDRLPLEVRQDLQYAATIGKEFHAAVLQSASPNPDRVADHLLELERAGLVQDLGGGERYRFRHDLTNDAINQSILRQDRPELHRVVGTALESHHATRLEDIAANLAIHFDIAEDHTRARKYAWQAAQQSARVFAVTEAIRLYQICLKHSQAIGEPLAEQRLIYERLGRNLELASRFEEAFELYESVGQMSRAAGQDDLRLWAMLAMATLRVIANTYYDPLEGQRLLEEASQLADQQGDRASRAKILWQLMLLDISGKHDVATRLTNGEEALRLAREENLTELEAFVLHDQWYGLGTTGQWVEAITKLEQACRIWESLGNDPMYSESQLRQSVSYQMMGEYEKAEAHSQDAFARALRSNNADQKAISRSLIGQVLIDRGEWMKAIEIMEETIKYGDPVGNVTACIATRADLAQLYIELHQEEKAASLLEEAQQVNFPLMLPWAHAVEVERLIGLGRVEEARQLGATMPEAATIKANLGAMGPLWIRVNMAQARLALADENPSEALRKLDWQLDCLQGEGLVMGVAEGYTLRAEIHEKLGSPDQAAADWETVLELAMRSHSRRYIWKAHAGLARTLADARGRGHLEHARNMIMELADELTDDALRQGFLGRTAIGTVLLA